MEPNDIYAEKIKQRLWGDFRTENAPETLNTVAAKLKDKIEQWYIITVETEHGPIKLDVHPSKENEERFLVNALHWCCENKALFRQQLVNTPEKTTNELINNINILYLERHRWGGKMQAEQRKIMLAMLLDLQHTCQYPDESAWHYFKFKIKSRLKRLLNYRY